MYILRLKLFTSNFLILWKWEILMMCGLQNNNSDSVFFFTQNLASLLPLCFGERLLCSNSIKKSMGMEIDANEITKDAKEKSGVFGNLLKPDPIKCMPACKVQYNYNQMSHALYPLHKTYFYQKNFCYVASHIWQISCQNEYREYFMRKEHPFLCTILHSFEEYFGNTEYWSLKSTVIMSR